MRLTCFVLTTSTLTFVAAAVPCSEQSLHQGATMLLNAHTDAELGGVGAGKRGDVGFQYLKPAEALLAAQALAHDDFDLAAAQVFRILEYQKPDGLLPHLVYGPSVSSELRWIPSNRTFFPGPAFWQQSSIEQRRKVHSASEFETSTISAPPVAADVVWEIFQLAPYDSMVGGKATAVQFLCHVYEPLRKLQKHLFSTRNGTAPDSLLLTRHPWETFSSLSPHWIAFLADLKTAPDYDTIVSSIPEEASARFAEGASAIYSAKDAVRNLYEPMIYLASQARHDEALFESISSAKSGIEAAPFGVKDVEFNALVLRSSRGLENIGRVLIEHSFACKKFALTPKEVLNDIKESHVLIQKLEGALIGNNNTQGLWNTSADFFADSSRVSWTSLHSLREFLPAYAVELDSIKKMRLMKHFLSEPGSFTFYCNQFPASFFACAESNANLIDARPASTTWVLYNYFLQRGFVRNKFPGLADYIRNKTRDMVCKASSPAHLYILNSNEFGHTALTLAYDSRNAVPLQVFDDSYIDSTLAAATILNILLPAVTLPPSPDTPPIDHHILSVIMCVELVVAFGVAMSCFLFSVYFVANRPRETRLSPTSVALRQISGSGRTLPWYDSDRHRSDLEVLERSDQISESSCSVSSPRLNRASHELKESLLSEEEEHYGSIGDAKQQQTRSNSAWITAKKILADISPW